MASRVALSLSAMPPWLTAFSLTIGGVYTVPWIQENQGDSGHLPSLSFLNPGFGATTCTGGFETRPYDSHTLTWQIVRVSPAGCVKTPSERGNGPRNRHSRESGNPGGVEWGNAA